MPTLRTLRFDLINRKNRYLSPEIVDKFLCDYFGLNPVEYSLSLDKEFIVNSNFENVLRRIINGEPYQYVFHKTLFLGVELYVDENVLIPRQETEQLVLLLISKIKKVYGNKKIKILDIGSGSGNIGILLGKCLKNAEIYAIDISNDAINITNKNAKINNVKIHSFNIDIFANDIFQFGEFDVIVSNPPYIKDETTVDEKTLKYEPHLALFSVDQLAYYKRIFAVSKNILKTKGILAFEIDENIKKSLEKEIKINLPNFKYEFSNDIYNKNRYLIMESLVDLEKAKNVLLADGIIAFPTDTVMGLGIIYDSEKAFHKLEVVKNRPSDKPYTLMVGMVSDIPKYAFVNNKYSRLINNLLPGPLTVLLPVRENVPKHVTKGLKTIGIRVAPTKEVRDIILKCQKPLLVPSANKNGENPALSSEEVFKIFGRDVGYILPGEAEQGIPTTIVDLTKDSPLIVRQGKITLDMILKAMEE